MPRFKLAVVGAGRMGQTHLAALQGSESVEVSAVVDPRDEVCAALMDRGIATFPTVAELVSGSEIDGVLVAAPTNLHLGIIAELTDARLPVLCEKPCGVSPEQARRAVEAAEKSHLPLQIAYWRRYVPDLAQLRSRIRSGELGDILSIRCLQWDQSPPPTSFREGSGGIFIDMGVHEFDQIRWLTGQEFGGVKAVASDGQVGYRKGDDSDAAEVVATLSGGTAASVSLGRWYPSGDMCAVEVYGSLGSVSLSFLAPGAGDEVFRAALVAQAEDFARVVGGSPGGGATAADAVAALEVARSAAGSLGLEDGQPRRS